MTDREMPPLPVVKLPDLTATVALGMAGTKAIHEWRMESEKRVREALLAFGRECWDAATERAAKDARQRIMHDLREALKEDDGVVAIRATSTPRP